MDFLKQKGPLAREFCNTLIYIISLVSLKPSSLQRVLTELQWNGMWFFSLAFFRCHLYGNAVRFFAGYRSLHCMESIKWKCQRSRISQSSADCPMRKSESFHWEETCKYDTTGSDDMCNCCICVVYLFGIRFCYERDNYYTMNFLVFVGPNGLNLLNFQVTGTRWNPKG